MAFAKVSVIGLGYIGLPTAAVIASRGVEVIGIDVSEKAVDTINQGKVHIVEPDLDMVVQAAVTMGKLRASLTPEPADAFMIAVPTPFKEGKKPDLSFIEKAANAIAPVLEKGNLIVLESTSPVGATEKLTAWLQALRPDLHFPGHSSQEPDMFVAHCPERVLPGRVLEELVSNDRIIGGMSAECSDKAIELYDIFVRGNCLKTTARTAEMAKLTENSFRDVNIAFANELSMICDELHINVWDLIALANRHPRVNILTPGPGVGGHCIAVDPWFIVDSAPKTARMIRTAREVNDGKPGFVIDKIKKAADEFKRPVIACLGLAFKPDIDDLRESPALDITLKLAQMGLGKVLAVEPNIKALPEKSKNLDIELVGLNESMERANIVVVLVDHKQFKSMDISDIASKVVVDTRGIFTRTPS
ncbi:UDP-N-acetyl-D-mannosamine dehydrogenase [Aliiglaciecola sp. 2_MG-2023]|uniref:UDP-N-acetyl-D-mannosamine dehydrogenase n=1 Tax=unclassified Aliiglaciecola TaxID=2593648 RepID=UPI0026E264C4|nr:MULTISPECIES: UDP-N-acetyl-D-mannosamine dehydrogenase [unclassified Aliiglaciecola]MDO6709998.1 UDP-N-acetyl-D-mannosamine dehydrogenase [Aliiglaciecola sp. 2_MG-2023]MDO6751146.1 UDP-N-acetyl-D-mannosamine dehydrogenase [Aliiglaciecola sp. 1_MG-2023]